MNSAKEHQYNLTWRFVNELTTINIKHVCRYIDALIHNIKAVNETSDKKRKQQVIIEKRDLALLRLFETFAETAPQLTLQYYILVAVTIAGKIQ